MKTIHLNANGEITMRKTTPPKLKSVSVKDTDVTAPLIQELKEEAATIAPSLKIIVPVETKFILDEEEPAILVDPVSEETVLETEELTDEADLKPSKKKKTSK